MSSSADSVSSHEGSHLWTLEEIGRLTSHSGNHADTLSNIVLLIQQRFGTDVCSVYLLEPDRVDVPHDVFAHDDGVVDQHADRER